jgi:hypothetical protein
VPVTVTGSLGANNQFIAQLSDAQGSFDEAENIWLTAGTTGGNFDVTLPAVLAADAFDQKPMLIGSHTSNDVPKG